MRHIDLVVRCSEPVPAWHHCSMVQVNVGLLPVMVATTLVLPAAQVLWITLNPQPRERSLLCVSPLNLPCPLVSEVWSLMMWCLVLVLSGGEVCWAYARLTHSVCVYAGNSTGNL